MVEAKEYHEKALKITIEIGDREGQGICYKQLRNVFQSLGECDTAEEYLTRGLSLSKDIGDSQTELECYFFSSVQEAITRKVPGSFLLSG